MSGETDFIQGIANDHFACEVKTETFQQAMNKHCFG